EVHGGDAIMCAAMAVQALYALQNGFMGAQRSLLFYGEYSEARTQIPITCYVVRTSDAVILFDTGVAPRAVPGLLRNGPFVRLTRECPARACRRFVLREGTHRGRAHARRRLAPDAAAQHHHEAHDHCAPHRRTHLSQPRPRLLADGEARTQRVSLRALAPAAA